VPASRRFAVRDSGLTHEAGARTIERAMSEAPPDVLLLDRRVEAAELRRLVERYEDMVKYVADVERGLIAIGGEMHVDGEQLLLESGSRQADLWGANYYPGRGRDGCIEYTSFINIRPSAGNRSMELTDPGLRDRVRQLTFALVGEGELL
jgi:hypothetical protein